MQLVLNSKMDQKDTFNNPVTSLLEGKVTTWLSNFIGDMRRSSPVQQWLESMPSESRDDAPDDKRGEEELPTPEPVSELKLNDVETKNLELTSEKEEESKIPCDENITKTSPENEYVPSSKKGTQHKKILQRDLSIHSDCPPRMKYPLYRDSSLQSDASGSSGSSVLNVLGARQVDAEAVLLALGFGPSEKQQKLQRIPDRFLKPSKLKGISTEKFIEQEQHSIKMHDCGVFGYRGLTGSPDVPPSTIVAKIMECILQDEECREQVARHSLADIHSAATRFRDT